MIGEVKVAGQRRRRVCGQTFVIRQFLGQPCVFRDEDWGRLRSVRVHYFAGLEVEFGFVSSDWASTDPVEAGTKQVVQGGLRPLYDPHGLLRRLAASVSAH